MDALKEDIPTKDSGFSQSPISEMSHARSWSWLSLCLISVVGTLIIAFSIIPTTTVRRRSQEVDQCGFTPEDARARGCEYDLTSFSWLPESCLDRDIEEEFLAAKPWHFYRGFNGTELVDEAPLEEVRRGETTGYFVTFDFHAGHCAFLLKKLHRALKKGQKVDSYITTIKHTDHCIQMMLDPPPEYDTRLQFSYRKYPYCGDGHDGYLGIDLDAILEEAFTEHDYGGRKAWHCDSSKGGCHVSV